jgi:hypothetical protein
MPNTNRETPAGRPLSRFARTVHLIGGHHQLSHRSHHADAGYRRGEEQLREAAFPGLDRDSVVALDSSNGITEIKIVAKLKYKDPTAK